MSPKFDKDLIRYHLRENKILNIISDDMLNQLRLVMFQPNEYIAQKNHPADQLYFYINGRSKVTYTLENGKSLLLRFYTGFEIIGDIELFDHAVYISDVIAISNVTCIGISSEYLMKNVHKYPDLLIYLNRTLTHKLVSANKASAINLLYPLENRLAAYLMVVSEKSDKNLIDEIETGNMTELADLLGTSYRQLTRVMKKFKELKLIRKSENRIEIINSPAINILAKGLYL